MQAYTYTIKHIPSNRWYYGVRKSSTYDLGTIYFSSSKIIKKLIKSEPIENFEFKLRKKFNCFETALIHEQKMLRRLQVTKNNKFINQAVSAGKLQRCLKDEEAALQRKQKISQKLKDLWQIEEYRENQLKRVNPERMRELAKLSQAKRRENYALGINVKKRKPKQYKDITIHKNNQSKIIKQNQFNAYKNCGWTKEL